MELLRRSAQQSIQSIVFFLPDDLPMKFHEAYRLRRFLVAVTFSSHFVMCASQDLEAGISEAIAPLAEPTLDSAKRTVTALKAISSDKSLPEHRKAQGLIAVIKDTFTAEHSLQKAITQSETDFKRSGDLVLRARTNLKPNTMGTVNQVAAEANFESAKKLRDSTTENLNTEVGLLENALKKYRSVCGNLDLTDDELRTLNKAALSVETRALNAAHVALANQNKLVPVIPDNLERELAQNRLSLEQKAILEELYAKLEKLNRAALRHGNFEDVSRVKLLLINACSIRNYIANKNTKEVHLINSQDPRCQIQEIKNFVYFPTLRFANSYGFDNCAHCLGGSMK